MKVEEVRNLNWVKVEDWKGITTYESKNARFVSDEDVTAFVENIFRDIARKLNIPAEELLPILKEENKAFFIIKTKTYQNYKGVGPDSREFNELKALLRIPDISFLCKEECMLNIILEKASELSEDEKAKVIEVLSSQIKGKTKIERLDPIKFFDDLSDIEKFNLMKYLDLFEVKVEIIKPR